MVRRSTRETQQQRKHEPQGQDWGRTWAKCHVKDTAEDGSPNCKKMKASTEKQRRIAWIPLRTSLHKITTL